MAQRHGCQPPRRKHSEKGRAMKLVTYSHSSGYVWQVPRCYLELQLVERDARRRDDKQRPGVQG